MPKKSIAKDNPIEALEKANKEREELTREITATIESHRKNGKIFSYAM